MLIDEQADHLRGLISDLLDAGRNRRRHTFRLTGACRVGNLPNRYRVPAQHINAGSAAGGGLRRGVTSRPPETPDTGMRNRSPRDSPSALARACHSARVAAATRRVTIRPGGACDVVRSAIGNCQRIIRPRCQRRGSTVIDCERVVVCRIISHEAYPVVR